MNKEADQPKGPDSQEQELRKIGKEKLQEILTQHKRWIESEGKEGTKARLGGANLQEADLGGANLQEADLRGANLQKAILVEAKLQGAILIGAQLQNADLRGAKLQGADLMGARLQKAELDSAQLQEANLYGANLEGADLMGAGGLNTRQVKAAKNWKLAFYSDAFLKELGLPPDHNETVKKKLAELEEKKKATGGK